jgi:hypothetical protein
VQFTIAYLMQDDSLNAPSPEIRERQLEISKKYKQRGQEIESLIVRKRHQQNGLAVRDSRPA